MEDLRRSLGLNRRTGVPLWSSHVRRMNHPRTRLFSQFVPSSLTLLFPLSTQPLMPCCPISSQLTARVAAYRGGPFRSIVHPIAYSRGGSCFSGVRDLYTHGRIMFAISISSSSTPRTTSSYPSKMPSFPFYSPLPSLILYPYLELLSHLPFPYPLDHLCRHHDLLVVHLPDCRLSTVDSGSAVAAP